jgi:hypothetical protein
MVAMADAPTSKHDPRHLRVMMDRAVQLSREHGVPSVFVGIAGREGDLLAPEFIEFVESGLRMEDVIFRLLRERAVLLLTDVERPQAEAILARLLEEFAARFAPSVDLDVSLGYYPIGPGGGGTTLKEVLPALFEPVAEDGRDA